MNHEKERWGVALLRQACLVFWDFDGVIKDSVLAKSVGFEQLFFPYGKHIADRVRQHHEDHGGVSRFEKMPLYLSWAGELSSADVVQDFCDRFSRLVCEAVIDAVWVPGVREYLMANHARQYFVLVSATPQAEMERILTALDLGHCFREVHGAPISKAYAIRDVLDRVRCPLEGVLVVGDSETDFNAAEANHVAFLLRRTSLNRDLQRSFQGPSFDHLGVHHLSIKDE